MTPVIKRVGRSGDNHNDDIKPLPLQASVGHNLEGSGK